ncbi:MAG: aminoglycoside phosphotransferase family protein [Armatimonadetes bacterium]|nr:aminoglycoside phosphotransferase family protein [Armatimonadota bacterium]
MEQIFDPTSIELAHKILLRHGLSTEQVEPAPIQGVANQTWLCGDWVVRVSKDPEYLSDLRTESAAVPAAVEHGVATPKPLVIDLVGDDQFPPFSIWERCMGQPLSRVEELQDPERFFGNLGTELSKIHRIRSIADPDRYLDEAWFLNYAAIRASALGTQLQEPVERAIELVGNYADAFVHQDLHADNILVTQSGVPVILDWGDAGFGDPAADFRFVPAQFLGDALARYEEPDPGFRYRVALHILDQHFYCQVNARSYGRYGDSSWEEIVRLFEFLLP